ncbi:MAG: hypothetical protein AVDCRST_MAG27-4479 [uncultured Craurococcus sp.]|uniref:Uncharacterized protein n=1 Tax=uncultured Craurococcus sp. TaxID=1135998 RepID=A0A6J4JRR2_9PROT|nr:MAG: hypothetical protein AVDCRST_MAG27-4479 [uncultured Craurococcus sp.]
MVRVLALALLLAAPAAMAQEPGCAALGPVLDWRGLGLGMRHPAGFALAEAGPDTARFATRDGQASATVTAIPNGMQQSLAAVMDEARQDITGNSGGEITYARARANWFVLSGYMAGRIFYRRSLVAADRGVIGTLWIEFPRAMKPCFEAAVTTMSLSFRELPR